MPDGTPTEDRGGAAAVRALLIDLDGAVPDQPEVQRRLAAGTMTRIDARDLAARLRIVASRGALADLRGRIERAFPLADGPPPLIFYGSGDFHHLAALFLSALSGPLMVLHIDNHPDWTTFPATWNCGSWVNRALELPGIRRVVTIGPASGDLDRPQWSFANLDAIRRGTLEVHPWRAPSSRLWGRRIDAPGCTTVKGRLVWHCLEGQRWEDFIAALDRRLPQLPVWVSLDKDALVPADAVTNWDQGGLTLDAVLALIRCLAGRRPLLGMDVCGDHSPPAFSDPFRALLSATDRPVLPAASPDAARAVNGRTNARIMEAADDMAAKGLWAKGPGVP